MSSNVEQIEMKDLMGQVFPGYEDFGVDSVTPSITGKDPIVSFLVVCNQEASHDFEVNEDISVEVTPSVRENKGGQGKDLILRFEFSFPVFSLQFFTAVEAQNGDQQQEFARILSRVDFFVVWLVDEEKKLLKVLKIEWDKDKNQKILGDFFNY
jgi:hypothetical protein